LTHQGADVVAPVLDLLADRGYEGVLTLEVFGREDFFTSRALIAEIVDGKR
jgi:sugar phosphate isomerase/epimerase